MREWEKTTSSLDAHAIAARDEMMASLIQLSKEEIKGERGKHTGPRGGIVWDKAESGKPPMNRTGNLRRSITGVKGKEGFGTYTAIVGPGMKYARHLELGGPKWEEGVKFPFMEPAWRKFQSIGMEIIKKHFNLGRI
jgi:Bacteriophage HK97-gp10, putative tail-component